MKMIDTIRRQTLALIAEITENPKPNYSIDGQSVSWSDYLLQLQKTIEWCDKIKKHAETPVEIISQAR